MRFELIVQGETDDDEHIKDAIKILETSLPYMFDNVVVTSRIVNEREG